MFVLMGETFSAEKQQEICYAKRDNFTKERIRQSYGSGKLLRQKIQFVWEYTHFVIYP